MKKILTTIILLSLSLSIKVQAETIFNYQIPQPNLITNDWDGDGEPNSTDTDDDGDNIPDTIDDDPFSGRPVSGGGSSVSIASGDLTTTFLYTATNGTNRYGVIKDHPFFSSIPHGTSGNWADQNLSSQYAIYTDDSGSNYVYMMFKDVSGPAFNTLNVSIGSSNLTIPFSWQTENSNYGSWMYFQSPELSNAIRLTTESINIEFIEN